MPSWQPNWEDVRFDHAGAEAAAVECDACAQFLMGRHGVLGPSREAARAQWRGVHRQRFDNETDVLDHDADALTDELRMTAAHIRREAEEARVEQHRRGLERERWFEERAREEAAERLRLAQEAEAARVEAALVEAVRVEAAAEAAREAARVEESAAVLLVGSSPAPPGETDPHTPRFLAVF